MPLHLRHDLVGPLTLVAMLADRPVVLAVSSRQHRYSLERVQAHLPLEPDVGAHVDLVSTGAFTNS